MWSVCLGQMSCLQLAFQLLFFFHLREQNVNNCQIEVGSAIILEFFHPFDKLHITQA